MERSTLKPFVFGHRWLLFAMSCQGGCRTASASASKGPHGLSLSQLPQPGLTGILPMRSCQSTWGRCWEQRCTASSCE
ncbi:hypothetical protein COCSUDRAFT_53546 [Coccomyxa subellipsoidea C-169]|uniref:Secreted protein n=1 Tax=Coccomyxa subellipsoidea (strain C-169) TaxID=574566 RepID=I0YXT8_COCSC|nr:hypothetical protein COCSUDRAFT_53546 [Coccomyxa subellipsoidea C-169]EIE23207.1 hypothetical protein COCSUDRAFT_53546 [Coccomyxa subellipsoidea C-169]|eukprot:XP_005647751.1 hypothetical protein COCSUDRAFT_53546 [Coccomyxa subellipsoidea C-169]